MNPTDIITIGLFVAWGVGTAVVELYLWRKRRVGK